MFSSAASRGLRLTGKICSGRVAQIHVSSRHSLLYGYWAYVLGERTTKRFGPNSKIITVDGNLASGKGQIAKKLADRLGMRYFPEADEHYLDKTTGDGSILPSKFSGNCSLDKFYDDPKCPDGNSYRLQSWMYSVRLMQYSDALEHLLSTGIDHYNEIKGNSIDEFLPPHLVIYVDVPAAEVHKKILERGHVVEDIEYLKFDKSPWTEQNDVTYHHLRMFVEDKDKVASLITVPSYIPEITIGASEYDSAYYQYRSLPGRKYTKGYNADIGDKMIWLK
ncbi:hypothetical protein XELAEV_18044813mg [Xenopus laevis]|uniref:Deoxynucleoside kinase domain-containing protein n=1 Tax=Xenopus laevis TaxID=8355 RepID=A0A974BZH9_XENLA|nr:hypothetical protein XELAEV_18044813mg [Xenopus laevis]